MSIREKWINEAVGELERLERALSDRLGEERVANLREVLEADWGQSCLEKIET